MGTSENEVRERVVSESRRLAQETTRLRELREQRQALIDRCVARRDEMTRQMRQGRFTVQSIRDEQGFMEPAALEITALDAKLEVQERLVEAQRRALGYAEELLRREAQGRGGLDRSAAGEPAGDPIENPRASDKEAAEREVVLGAARKSAEKPSPSDHETGLREELVQTRAMAAQGVRELDGSQSGSELPGLDVTTDNLRHSQAEARSGRVGSEPPGRDLTADDPLRSLLEAQLRAGSLAPQGRQVAVDDVRRLLAEARLRQGMPEEIFGSRSAWASVEAARRLHQEAERDAQELRARAQQDYQRALEEGRRQGYEEGARQAAQLLAEARALREKLVRETEPQLIKLALKVAEKIIGQELDHNKDKIARIVGKALETVRHQKQIRLRVNPADLVAIEAARPQLLAHLGGEVSLELKSDEAVQRGGCMIDTEIGSIDAQLGTQLEQIARILLGGH
jgi:type III secretion protein L